MKKSRFAARHKRADGFALLVTLTLLAFLVLLLVSLASLTRVETQVAGNNQQLSRARANALFALNAALGRLQQFTGPDQRATSPADLGDGTNNARPVPQNGARHWTGVWGNANAATASKSSPVFLNWLVSGNEAVTVTANTDGSIASSAASPATRPDDSISSLAGATALSTHLTIGSQPARLLVGPGSVGASDGGLGEAGYVVAALKDIQVAASTVPGLGASGDATIGRYAWWIGDEGIKARANLVETEASISAADTAGQRLRYRAPARAGVELMGGAPAGLADADLEGSATTSLRAEIRKVVSARQLNIASGGAIFPTAFLQAHFHDLSTTSMGVIANSLAGGLRQDLTAAFAQGTDQNDAPSGPIWQLGANGADKGPDWQLLRSYYQLPFSSGASGTGSSLALDPRSQIDGTTNPASPAQHGIFPVVAFWQWFIEARLNGGPGTYSLELRHYPAIVLWNPYNVTLKDHAYRVSYKIAGGNVAFARVSPRASGETYSKVPGAVSAEAQLATPWVTSMNLTVQSGDMAPGEAYVYTLAQNIPYTTDTAALYTLKRGWNGAGANAVVVGGNSFTLSGAASGYMVSFWCGTNTSGANTIPAWNVETATVPSASGSNIEPTLREDTLTLSTSSDEPLQVVNHNNNYENAFKMRFVRSSLLYQDLRAIIGYVGHKWALKTTALGAIDNAAYYKNNPVRWLADYNPRAPVSARSPYEMQGGGYGYFISNPSFDFSTSSRRYGKDPFDPVNSDATIECDPSTGRAFVGMSQNNWDGAGESTVVLYNVPRKEHPMMSLGELQHVQPYRVNGNSWASNASPAYPFGNSLADPRGNLDSDNKPWSEIAISTSAYASFKPAARVYDYSYVFNRALWDAYYFSSVRRPAEEADVSFPLPNPRIVSHARATTDVNADLRDAKKSAASLLVSGAFNINSTSAQAWRALLGGLNNVPAGSTRKAKGSPYPRLQYPLNDGTVLDPAAVNAGTKAAAYEGYRFLSDTEIAALADRIVVQVRRRGPFLSIADFVNRALDAGPVPGSQDNRLMGALAQALVDAGINNNFNGGQQAMLPPVGGDGYTSMNTQAAAGATATNAPGWLTQADLLQSLGSVLSARSDTFTLRAYGETVNPLLPATDSGYITGRAWCEAVVQRLPGYVSSGDDPWTAPSALTKAENKTFGRRYQIVSFRWLSSNDI